MLRLPARQPRRERRLAAIVGGIAIVGATTSVAVAAQSALPGEALYPVKRVLEDARTSLSVGEGAKGTTLLANASDRLVEVDALIRQDGAVDDMRIPGTLAAFTDQATQASDLLLADYEHTGDESSIVALNDFASSGLDQLAALEPLTPPDARDELIRAAQTLNTIGAEATQRCPDCGGTPVDSLPPALVSATEQIFLPVVDPSQLGPAGQQGGRPGDRQGNQQGAQQGEGRPDRLPEVAPGDLGPGSVTVPSTSPQPGPGEAKNPLEQLLDGVTGGGSGGGNGGGPSSPPSIPVVGPLLGTVGDLLEGIVGPVVNPLLPGPTKKP